MLDLNIEQTGDVGILALNGELTIEHIDELKSAFIKMLDNTGHLYINLEKVNEIDISCFQLICSAFRTCLRFNKQITMVNCLPERVKQTFEDAGFSLCAGHSCDAGKSCVWKL